MTEASRHSSLIKITTVIWLGLSVAWVDADKLIRDGDEEGHVGAAELFLGDLNTGSWLSFLERLWIGPMGEYPQAFAAGVGAWWWAWDGGLPSATAVRVICLLSLLVTAFATARIARRYVPNESKDAGELIAYITVLSLPLGNGLTRHFMPEGALMAAVAIALLWAHRLVERPSVSRALQLGVVLGLGFLTKQTFAFLVAVPLLWVLRRLGRQSVAMLALSVVAASVISGPWWALNAADQLSYGANSLSNSAAGGVWAHLVYYPHVLLVLGLGPALALSSVFAGQSLRKQSDQRGWIFGLMWLIGGLIILTLIPKKYPRLIAPLTPAIGIWIAMAWARAGGRRMALSGLGIGAILSVIWASVSTNPHFLPEKTVDLGCPQIWLRPPAQDDHGLSTVQQTLSSQPNGAIFVEQDYEIPCAIQTTHNWSTHLSPYLRRSGQERDVHTDENKTHDFIIRVGPTEGTIPIWEDSVHMSIRDRLTP